MKIIKVLALSAALLLAACGSPADVQTAASAAGVAASDAAAAASAVGAAASELGVTESDAAAAASEIAAAASELGLTESDAAAAAVAIEGLTGSDPLRLQSDQPLVLSTTQEVAGVSNYRWVISAAPAGAEGVVGQVISENSDGKLTVEPADYAKYFPTAGEYTVDLILTFDNGTSQTTQIPIVVP